MSDHADTTNDIDTDTTNATDTDTAGHVLHGEAAENPTTGGGHAPSALRLSAAEDDTEGHRVFF